MANGQVLLLLCLGMLSSLKIVLGDYHVTIYIPGDEGHNVDDTTLNLETKSITVAKEILTSDFKCVKDQVDDQVIFTTLNTNVQSGKMKIEVLFGGNYYEFGTIRKVKSVDKKGIRQSGGYGIQKFEFTYSLDADRTEWSPCVFGHNYFGFKNRNKNIRQILLTCTPDVIGDLRSRSSKDWIRMRDINTNGEALLGYYYDYVIHGLQWESEKVVHGDVKAYILSYSAISPLQLT